MMFWTMAAILMVLWVLGMVSGATLGMWVHMLLVLALVSAIFALAQSSKRALY
jgi:hypothetical protein